MSVHIVYKQNGVKMMRPVLTREEYMKLRNGGFQQDNVARIRQGDEAVKTSLVQMNYSCLPNDDGTLKGSKRMSTTVGMDIDHIAPDEMASVKARILSKQDELGLLMLEESARGKGYHLVFRRQAALSQEQNLKWASDLLGVEYDTGAKDITRVFFTTTEAQLLFLDDEVFRVEGGGGTTEYPESPETPENPEYPAAAPANTPRNTTASPSRRSSRNTGRLTTTAMNLPKATATR